MIPLEDFAIREAISSDATAIWQLNCYKMGLSNSFECHYEELN